MTSKELNSELQKFKQENASLKASHTLQISELKKNERELQERVKELNCLYEIGRLMENEDGLDKIFQGVVDLIPNAWYYPEMACVRIVLEGREYQTNKFRETEWRQSVDLQLQEQPVGIIELYSLEERPAMDEGPILTQKRELLNLIAKRLSWVFERSRTKEALSGSEEKYRRLFDTMSTGVIYKAADGKIISANPAAEHLLGLSIDQMMGKTSMDSRWSMIREDRSVVPGAEHPTMQALKTGKKVGPVDRGVFIPEKNEYVWLSITAIPLFQPGEDKPFQVYATFDDITERKQAEEEMLKLSLAVEQSNATIVITDLDGRIQYANAAFEKTTGYTVEEVIGQNSRMLKSGYTPLEEYNKLWNTITVGGEWNGVFHNKRKNGSLYWESAKIAPIRDTAGNITHYLAVKEDITEHKLANDALEKSLKEKEVLLSEIHHRVKNNMAVISSLITLQTDYFTNETPENQLLDIRARIESMALVHEMVYEQQNFDRINFAKLLKRLIDHLQKIYQPKDKNISVQISADDTFLDMNKSVPLTLLTCEVVTNAWKHAFSGRKVGNIQLELKKKENEHCLVILDDGVGVADMDQIHNAKSFGWTIIHGLVNQLRGKLALSSPEDGGFRLELRFP